MVNEIPLSFYTLFVIIQIGLLLFSFSSFDKLIFLRAFCALVSAILGYMNANMILNKTVVVISDQSSAYEMVPIQSLPIHYFLMGLTIVAGLLFILFIIRILQKALEDTSSLGTLGGWD